MIDIRDCTLDSLGKIVSEVEDKKLMQFSHNQTFIAVLFPKTIDFDGLFLSYKNEYADEESEIALTVNTEYISNDYYQVIIPLIQPITNNYGSLDLWLTFRKGNEIIIVSERIVLYLKESTLYSENTLEYDIATEIANYCSALSKEVADLKSQIALNGVGSPVVIKYYGVDPRDNLETEIKAFGDISKGDLVSMAGTSSGSLLGQKAIASGVYNINTAPEYIIGVALSDILEGETGFVVTNGVITGLDTSSYTEGAFVYPDLENAGKMSSNAPSGVNATTRIGICIYNDSLLGTLMVRTGFTGSATNFKEIVTDTEVAEAEELGQEFQIGTIQLDFND